MPEYDETTKRWIEKGQRGEPSYSKPEDLWHSLLVVSAATDERLVPQGRIVNRGHMMWRVVNRGHRGGDVVLRVKAEKERVRLGANGNAEIFRVVEVTPVVESADEYPVFPDSAEMRVVANGVETVWSRQPMTRRGIRSSFVVSTDRSVGSNSGDEMSVGEEGPTETRGFERDWLAAIAKCAEALGGGVILRPLLELRQQRKSYEANKRLEALMVGERSSLDARLDGIRDLVEGAGETTQAVLEILRGLYVVVQEDSRLKDDVGLEEIVRDATDAIANSRWPLPVTFQCIVDELTTLFCDNPETCRAFEQCLRKVRFSGVSGVMAAADPKDKVLLFCEKIIGHCRDGLADVFRELCKSKPESRILSACLTALSQESRQ